MGCGGSKDDAKVTVDMQIRATPIQTGIIEFDQIFNVLAEVLAEAEEIRANAVPGRYNMLKIVKAHRLQNPSVVDAYTLWCWGLSCVNQGKLNSNGTFFKFTQKPRVGDNGEQDYDDGFEYGVGQSGEFKFDWFGDYLNDYVYGVRAASRKFPIVKQKAEAMFERVKSLKSQVFKFLELLPTTGDKIKTSGKIGINVAMFGAGIKICEEFMKQIEKYQAEIEELKQTHQQIEANADIKGKQIFNDFHPKEVPKLDPKEKQMYRMSCKMSYVVNHYWDGPKYSLAEQDLETTQKTERAKDRPRRPKGYKPDDLPIDEKQFPYRLRWVGCNALDLPLQEMSVALEDHNIQMERLKRNRKVISLKLGLWQLQNENMSEGLKVFLWALSAEKGALKQKLKAEDVAPFCTGLDKLKSSDADLEEVRQCFLDYFYLASGLRRGPLDESWDTFNQRFELLATWITGEFTNYLPFKQAKLADQYNMMTNVAKNIYALREYKPAAARIYDKGFKRVKTESETFWNEANTIIQGADAYADKVKGVKPAEIVGKFHDGPKKAQDAAQKRLAKLQKYYDEKVKPQKK